MTLDASGHVMDIAGQSVVFASSEHMDVINDETVTLVVTSPPYWNANHPIKKSNVYEIWWIDYIMTERDDKGHFIKGQHYSTATEFKKGQHWREPKPWWNRNWLIDQYINQKKSAEQIAKENGCKHNNIYYFLKKFGISIREPADAINAAKSWGKCPPMIGEKSPMYGKKGDLSPHWKGGITPDRQLFYESEAWINASREVWSRDEGKCRRCGKSYEDGIPFNVHHIIPFSVKELRASPGNLILLCKDCHNFVHSKRNIEREYMERK